VVADCAYSTSDHWYAALGEDQLAYVVAIKPHCGTWAQADQPHTPVDAARALKWTDADHPRAWTAVVRSFLDGHTETWWAADATLGGWNPNGPCRLVVATTDPATLSDKATAYLATNLPRPGSPPAYNCPHPPADLADIVHFYGLRPWIEQSYKQVKDELGWADFPGPLRPRHPPLPDPGQLHVLVLLAAVVRPTGSGARPRPGRPGTGPATEGNRPRPAPCAPSTPLASPGDCLDHCERARTHKRTPPPGRQS
jgi:hypothetical protein